MNRFRATFYEDSSHILLGRLASPDATGDASPVSSEGNLVVQADVASITLAVYDTSGCAPETAVYSATLAAGDVIFDTLQTSGIWANLSYGGNLYVAVPATAFPTGGHNYLAEVRATLVGGATGWSQWSGPALPTPGS